MYKLNGRLQPQRLTLQSYLQKQENEESLLKKQANKLINK